MGRNRMIKRTMNSRCTKCKGYKECYHKGTLDDFLTNNIIGTRTDDSKNEYNYDEYLIINNIKYVRNKKLISNSMNNSTMNSDQKIDNLTSNLAQNDPTKSPNLEPNIESNKKTTSSFFDFGFSNLSQEIPLIDSAYKCENNSAIDNKFENKRKANLDNLETKIGEFLSSDTENELDDIENSEKKDCEDSENFIKDDSENFIKDDNENFIKDDNENFTKDDDENLMKDDNENFEKDVNENFIKKDIEDSDIEILESKSFIKEESDIEMSESKSFIKEENKIFFMDRDYRNIISECKMCISNIPEFDIIYKNENFTLFISDHEPLLENSFLIRNNSHLSCLASSSVDLKESLTHLKCKLVKDFKPKNKTLIFVECHLASEFDKHFNIKCFPLETYEVAKFWRYFKKGIKEYCRSRGEILDRDESNLVYINNSKNWSDSIPEGRSYLTIFLNKENIGFLYKIYNEKTFAKFRHDLIEDMIYQFLHSNRIPYVPRLETFETRYKRCEELKAILQSLK